MSTQERELKFRSPFLNSYLEMVEDTESPRIFHVWSALVGISACLGRRVFVQRGHKQLYSNMFITLVGPPGVRKSTAMDIMANRLRNTTAVRFAPDDTGGQRQGLLKAMQSSELDEEQELQKLMGELNAAEMGALDKIKDSKLCTGDPRDLHSMFVAASEFSSFLGRNALDMLTFLIKMWDGDNYEYKLKNETLRLEKPLLSLIGCTTPTNISTSLPAEAIGQGFTSRMILVYSATKYKSIARPKPFDERLVREIEEYYRKLSFEFDGEMKESTEGAAAIDALYTERIEWLNDPRFLYYVERRHDHLIKLSMIIAASRLSRIINAEDVREAHAILRATELAMPDALGEYGLSKVGAARQKMIEFLQFLKGPCTSTVLFAVMAKDMSFAEYSSALADLQNAGKITRVHTKDGDAFVYNDQKKSLIDEVLAELIEDENEQGAEIIPLRG